MREKKILKIFSFSSSDGWTHGEILEFQKIHLNSDWLLFSNTDGKYSVDTFVNRWIPPKASCLPSSVLQSRRPRVYNN